MDLTFAFGIALIITYFIWRDDEENNELKNILRQKEFEIEQLKKKLNK